MNAIEVWPDSVAIADERGLSHPTEWPESIRKEWRERIMPRFKDGETCSQANHFAPRPYVDEYNRGSDRFGFTYTVQPGNRVCQTTWTVGS